MRKSTGGKNKQNVQKIYQRQIFEPYPRQIKWSMQKNCSLLGTCKLSFYSAHFYYCQLNGFPVAADGPQPRARPALGVPTQ